MSASLSLGLRCRRSPGKRLRCLRSIPETAVTPSLAPGVSALRYNRRWRRARWAERWWWWWWEGRGGYAVASADRLQHNFVQHHVSLFFLPPLSPPSTHKALWEKGRVGSHCKYTRRDRQTGEDSGCSLRGQSDSLPPPHPTHPPGLEAAHGEEQGCLETSVGPGQRRKVCVYIRLCVCVCACATRPLPHLRTPPLLMITDKTSPSTYHGE